MTREEFATKVQDLVNQAYLHDVDDKYYKGLMHEAEKLRYPITLAEFLGWEEGKEYRRGSDIFKVVGDHLLDKGPSGRFYNAICSTDGLIDLRNATKYEPLYYAKIKNWQLYADFVGTQYWGVVSDYGRLGFVNADSANVRTKDEWNEMGINKNNAEFVLEEEAE